MCCSYNYIGTLASRAAVRDIGRVLEVPYGEVDSFAKLIPFNPSNPLTLSAVSYTHLRAHETQ